MKRINNFSGSLLVLSFLLLSPLFFVSPVSHAEVSQGTMIEIFERLDRLEKKSRELVGENEVLKHELTKLKKIQKEGFLNVDERVDALRQQIRTARSAEKKEAKEEAMPVVKKTTPVAKPVAPKTEQKKEEAKSATTAAVTTPVVKKSTEVKKESVDVKTTQAAASVKTEQANKASSKSRAPSKYEKETYQAAFSKMKKSPTAATQAFREYIKMQPNSPLAANAQYWIAEIMYSHNNYKGAIQEFIKVLQQYKYSDKAPDAAIKLGYSFVALKNWNYARRTFNDVLKYFPKNQNAVSLAKKQLAKLEAAGH
jgi:tol-pal system protein YbgF